LKQVLDDPHHGAFLPLVEVLSTSQAAGVIGLLLAFLDDSRAPASVLAVIAKRCDLKFLQFLLRKIGRKPSKVVRQNLKRIESVAWLRDRETILHQLDDMAQHAAVQLAVASAIPRSAAFSVVKSLLLAGKPGGRRAAADALNEFNGAEANALVLEALEDEDPQVQAKALVQLRPRGILRALPRLLEKVDSPHAVVRRAARVSLGELSFKRFLSAFDALDDEVRRSTGTLVKKVDPETVPRLSVELEAKARSRRLRALAIARLIGVVQPLESTILGLLDDDDHMVRAEAAAALAQGTLASSWAALEEALQDPSTTVQQAARESLGRRVPPAQPDDHKPRHDPRA
jgi:HEAT repeat protein